MIYSSCERKKRTTCFYDLIKKWDTDWQFKDIKKHKEKLYKEDKNNDVVSQKPSTLQYVSNLSKTVKSDLVSQK